MSTPASESRTLTQAGVAALGRSDPKTARVLFERAIASGAADGSTWLGLAIACEVLGDRGTMDQAADKVLEVDPRNIRALLMKGEFLLAQDDRRAAVRYFNAVVGLAAQHTGLPAPLVEAVRRAVATRDRLNAEIEQELLDAMRGAGFDPDRAAPRFRHALDLLSGRKEIYLQQPRAFFYPELPHVQFFPRESFPWLSTIESGTETIRAELTALLEAEAEFEPYIRRASGAPMRSDHPLLDSLDWGAYFLWKDGAEIEVNSRRCPRTMAILEQIPLARIPGRTPSVLFSRLAPGARIPPHHGFLNTRLICHLPLVIPPNCGLRVGNETRTWREGEVLVFDDTIEHEAWNQSAEARVVMIFEIWRPELSEEERTLVAGLMQAIDATASGARLDWSAA